MRNAEPRYTDRSAAAVEQTRERIVDFIEDFTEREGVSPTHVQIAQGCGLKSLSTVGKHMSLLEREGIIQREHFRQRVAMVVRRRNGA